MGSVKRSYDPVRKLIREVLNERGIDMAVLSRQIGRSHSYIQQFMERHVPRELKERDRRRIAEALGLDESDLGGPARKDRGADDAGASGLRGVSEVAEYNALASAGGGILIDEEERVGSWPLPKAYLNEMHLSGNGLAVVPVKGDSMEPTLRSGDRVLIDLGDTNVSQGGLFVLYDGLGRVVKRVEHIPGSHPPKLALISDNPLHTRYEVDADSVGVIGRVVWAARRL